jgi:DNA polymerase III epsilon subunit-like protein
MIHNFKPFSENIVFFDTEFSGNKHDEASLLSLGMVKITGEQLYIELKYSGSVDPWVENNVLPYLNDYKVSNKIAERKIKKFVGNEKPYLTAYIYPFDYLYLEKLLGWDLLQELFHWPPIDFASILFGNNINPESYNIKDKNNFFKEIGIDVSDYKLHNALDDAKLLREVYLKMTSSP